METAQQKEIDPLFSTQATTREELMALGRKVNALIGVPEPPPMTREELNEAVLALHAAMRADGIRPEDNGATRELLRMHYGNDYDQDEE